MKFKINKGTLGLTCVFVCFLLTFVLIWVVHQSVDSWLIATTRFWLALGSLLSASLGAILVFILRYED